MTRTTSPITVPLPTPVVIDGDSLEDEDPFWTWTSERIDEMTA